MIPFDEEDIQQGLSALPLTKALAPDDLPAVTGRTLASEFAPLVFRTILACWN